MQPRFSIVFALGILFQCTCIIPAHAQKTNDAPKIISNGLSVLKTDTIKALELFRQAASAAQASGDKKITAEAYLHCAETEKLLDSNTAAIHHYEEAARLYDVSGMHTEAASVYTDLGKLQSDLALFDDALISFRKSDEIAVDRELNVIHANNLVGAGMVMTKKGELVNAQQNFVDALEIYEAAHDTAGLGDVWNGIGVVHWKEGKNEAAMNAYEKSLQFRLSVGDSLAIASSYSNIGIICRLQGKFETGLDYYFKALGIRRRHHDKRGEAQVLFNIGSMLTDMDRNEEGLDYYNQSYAIKKSIGDLYGLLPYYLNAGEVYGVLNRPAEQEKALVTGYALADSLNAADYIKSFSRDLADYYAKHNDFEKAFRFHKKYSEIKDTLISREKNAELSRLQAEYDLKEKQRDIEKLESQQEQMKAREERDEIFRYALITIIVIVLLFTAFVVNRTLVLRRTNRELATSKQLIEKRDKEKEILLKEVHHRVKNNLQLTSSLLNLQAREMKDSEAAQALKEARDRLKAISLVHQELFSGKELNSVNLSSYIPDLCNSVLESNNPGKNISIAYKLDDVAISLDTSVSVGLMLNEMLINSIKHAFSTGMKGEISVSCEKSPGGARITVSDNGKGIPLEVVTGERSGFGMKLLRSLANKLGTELEFNVDHGTRVSVVVTANNENA